MNKLTYVKIYLPVTKWALHILECWFGCQLSRLTAAIHRLLSTGRLGKLKLQVFALSTPIRTSEGTAASNHLVSGRNVAFSNTCNNTELQFMLTKGVVVGGTLNFRAVNARR